MTHHVPYEGGHRVSQHFMDALGRETNTVVNAVFEPGSAKVPDCVTTVPRTSETTSYPDGTSDYSIHTDPRGVRTVTTHTSHDDREVAETQTFSPTNLVNPVILSRNIHHRNGASESYTEWNGGWTRETSLTDYNPDGTRRSTTLSESSDCGTITNSIALSDFLERVVATITPLGIASNFYDGVTSRLIRSEATGQPVTLYTYDALGEMVATVQGGIDTASETRYESIDGEVWQVAIRSSSSEGVTNAVSTTRRQMTGLSNSLRSRSVSIDPNGSTTTEESAFAPATSELTTVRTTDAATPSVGVSKFGRTIRRESLRDAVDYYFDPFGRAECSEVFHPVTDEILYSRWSAFDESDNETDYVVHY